MVKIELRCPSCSKIKYIEIDEKIVNSNPRGVTAINVPEDQICNHTFVAYIDKNLDVRDCFLTDFKIELPQVETIQKVVDREIPDKDKIDIDLIKKNLSALTIASLLRAFLLKKPFLLLSDDEKLIEHLKAFFSFVSQDNFEYNFKVINREFYKKNKKQFKNYIVIDGKKVLNDKSKLLDPKKIKIERAIIQKFMAEYNPTSSLIIFKNEIQKAFELAKNIIEIIDSYEGDEKLGKKKVIDLLMEKKNIKISFSYLEFLLDIIKNYFNHDLSMLSDYYFPAFGI